MNVISNPRQDLAQQILPRHGSIQEIRLRSQVLRLALWVAESTLNVGRKQRGPQHQGASSKDQRDDNHARSQFGRGRDPGREISEADRREHQAGSSNT